MPRINGIKHTTVEDVLAKPLFKLETTIGYNPTPYKLKKPVKQDAKPRDDYYVTRQKPSAKIGWMEGRKKPAGERAWNE